MLDREDQRMALKLFEALDSPRSLTCAILTRYGEWRQLTELRVDANVYEPLFFKGVDRMRRDASATEFLRKCAGIPTGIDTREVAVQSFYQCERNCAATNVRLNRHLEFPVLTTALEVQADRLIRRAASWIHRLLGGVPDRLDGWFGPGATFESRGDNWPRAVVAYDKLQHAPAATASCQLYADHLVWQTALAGAWGVAAPNRLFETVPGNRFTTVPKDSSKDRGICIEPGLNLLGQLAIGSAIRCRLKRVGLDLKHGQDLHRCMAAEASVAGSFATIDLSNASDTICVKAVKLLLPDAWFSLLDDFRSKKTRMPSGTWVLLEKFSSMGNGFTFELETAIFAALAHAVGCRVGIDTWVYGDDIICPTDRARDLCALLRYMGFTPNDRKTFVEGCFKESCGGDFLFGHDVRPYYLKEFPREPSDWITFGNAMLGRALDWDMPKLRAVRRFCLDRLPTHVRHLRGPRPLGDAVIFDDDETKWSFHFGDGTGDLPPCPGGVRWFHAWVPVSRRKPLSKYPPHVALAAALMGLPSDGLAPRDSVQGYRIGLIAFS